MIDVHTDRRSSARARRALRAALADRNAKLAAAGAVAAGAAVAGGVALRERVAANGTGDRARSRKFRLRRAEGAADGIRRIAGGRAASAIEHLQGEAGDADSAEAVHEARKDLKKLRSTLRLVREELGEETYRLENRRFRDAGRRLSGARDAEVKLQTLEALEERFAEDLPAGELKGLRGALERERQAATDEFDADGDDAPRARAALEVEAGLAAVDDWPLRGDGWGLLAPGLRRSYRRGRNRLGDTRAEGSPENVHEWRKRVKDLWYHLRIIRGAWPAVVGETADEAHELSDLLGNHHDLAVLHEDLGGRAGIAPAADLDALRELIRTRQDELLGEALALGARLYAEKPKAFVSRLATYWEA